MNKIDSISAEVMCLFLLVSDSDIKIIW
jgi:hypothetical protein